MRIKHGSVFGPDGAHGAHSVLGYRLLCAALAASMLTLGSPEAHASDEIIARVTYTGTFGDGRLYVGLDSLVNEPGCPLPRFDVPATHPQIKTFIATALAAAASGRKVTVKASGCLGAYPTLAATSGSYFSLHGE